MGKLRPRSRDRDAGLGGVSFSLQPAAPPSPSEEGQD